MRKAPRRRFRIGVAVVFVAALAMRLGVILRSGGIHGIIGYDCGVYFADADALLHGRLPYRDFTMVHPPGIMLALTPFAALTRVMTDWHAFIVATLVFCVLSSVSAVLVVLLCRRLGITRRGALIAGLFYAVWFGAVSAEFEVKLEPLCNLLFLCGLLALLRDQRRPQRWSALLAGAVIGLTMSIKIWWVVPVVLILVWHGVSRRSARAALEATFGAALSVTAVCLPFFLVDPAGMWQSVITGQLGRTRTNPLVSRLDGMSTVNQLVHHLTGWEQDAVAIAFLVSLAVVVALGWRGSRRGRFLIVASLAQLAVLLEAPSWFEYYCDYVAVGFAVAVGAAAVAVGRVRLVRSPAAIVTAGALALTGLITVAGSEAIPAYAGAGTLTRALHGERCVMSNTTTLLLRLDAFSRDLANGCPNWVDVSGRLMGADDAAALKASHESWQEAELKYLQSGDAVILWPERADYLPVVRAALRKEPVIARSGVNVAYRVQPTG